MVGGNGVRGNPVNLREKLCAWKRKGCRVWVGRLQGLPDGGESRKVNRRAGERKEKRKRGRERERKRKKRRRFFDRIYRMLPS